MSIERDSFGFARFAVDPKEIKELKRSASIPADDDVGVSCYSCLFYEMCQIRRELSAIFSKFSELQDMIEIEAFEPVAKNCEKYSPKTIS